MRDSSFKLHIVTPQKIFEREVQHLRLKDETGFFGIMKGHIDFLTMLVPSLGYYTDINNKEIFLAINGGILSIKGGDVTLTSKEVFESEDAEELSEVIEKSFLKRDKTEQTFLEILKGIEKAFIEKTVKFERRK